MLSWFISNHFGSIQHFKLCVIDQNYEQFTKTPLFRVKGHLRSSMLTKIKSPSPVLVMICIMSVPICNHFHTKRANSSKMTAFWEGAIPLFDALLREKTPHPKTQNFDTKKFCGSQQ